LFDGAQQQDVVDDQYRTCSKNLSFRDGCPWLRFVLMAIYRQLLVLLYFTRLELAIAGSEMQGGSGLLNHSH
jgi:hypothetical protein